MSRSDSPPVLHAFMPKMATLSEPLLGFRMIMADISTEIDVRRSALIGRMLLSGAVLLVFGGSAYPTRQTTSVTTLPLYT
jgi:hypothetical protein